MSQIEGRIERKKQFVQNYSLEKMANNRKKLFNMNIAKDLEANDKSISEYSSDNLLTVPRACTEGIDKTYFNNFKMFDKLGHRRELSRSTNKAPPSIMRVI